MNLLPVSAICLAILSASQGSGTAAPPPEPSYRLYPGKDTCGQTVPAKITIHPGKTKQTIHSFGASDCWSAKFIGKWEDVQKKDRVADLLFSMDTTADGTPKGIGLSLWRFNIGAGSFEQGDASRIADEWRREECFQRADGSYDWSKQQGAQWFLRAAKQRGVKYTLGFSNSAPVHMTKNGKAFNSSGSTRLNLQEGKMDAFAGFMATVTRHFGFDYISPVNEPQWAWGTATKASQEGTPAANDEVAALTRLLSQQLVGTDARVVIGEAGQLDFLYGRNTDNRGDQISQFFSPASANYVGDQANVAHIISGHSYFTTCPDNNLIKVRTQLQHRIKQVDASLEAWQTEFGILGDICGRYNGSPRNTGIEYGLYVAKVLHHDLVIANMTSWQWWLAIGPYNYSDALVYINDPAGNINVPGCKTDGIVLDSRQLWAFGNYARFIRPGMQRVEATVEGYSDPAVAATTLMVSAYRDEAAKQLVVVIVNPESKEKNVQLEGPLGSTFAQYTTDATRSLKRTQCMINDISIPGKSIVTLTGTYQ